MAYGDFKDLKRRTASDKILHDKAFVIAKVPKYDGYQRGLAFHKFFDKKSSGNGIKNELAEELHKPTRKKYTHLLQTIFGVETLLICN